LPGAAAVEAITESRQGQGAQRHRFLGRVRRRRRSKGQALAADLKRAIGGAGLAGVGPQLHGNLAAPGADDDYSGRTASPRSIAAGPHRRPEWRHREASTARCSRAAVIAATR